jgi:hypothetical protein
VSRYRQEDATMAKIGDTAWLVEWCAELAFDEAGDVDRDRCRMVCRRVPTQDAAERLARSVWPQAAKTFGAVNYWPVEFVAYDPDDADRYPHAGFWEATAGGEWYEGPEEV